MNWSRLLFAGWMEGEWNHYDVYCPSPWHWTCILFIWVCHFTMLGHCFSLLLWASFRGHLNRNLCPTNLGGSQAFRMLTPKVATALHKRHVWPTFRADYGCLDIWRWQHDFRFLFLFSASQMLFLLVLYLPTQRCQLITELKENKRKHLGPTDCTKYTILNKVKRSNIMN